MRLEIICTGDEVLTGKIHNTNFSYITQRLEDVGLDVHRGLVVGDDHHELKAAFREAAQRADAVIVNGGLGPTVDDLSQAVAAEVAEVPLILNEAWLAKMEAFFAGRGRIMPPNNHKQALLPEGAILLDNPIGTACGFSVQIDKATFYFTPGVPRELQRMLEEQILPRLLKQQGNRAVIHLKRLHSYGLGESHVDQMLKGVEQLAPPGTVKLGFRAHYPQLETKITVRAQTETEIETYLTPVLTEVHQRIGNFVIAEDDQTLEGKIIAALAEQEIKLAIAEQIGGGLLSARLINACSQDQPPILWALSAPTTSLLRKGLRLNPARLPSADQSEKIKTMLTELAYAAQHESGSNAALVAALEFTAAPPITESKQDQKVNRNRHGQAYFAALYQDKIYLRHAEMQGTTHWIRTGMIELGLDFLRRCLYQLPIIEKTDFELKPAVR